MRVQGVIYGLGALALFGAHVGSGVTRAETLPFSHDCASDAWNLAWVSGAGHDRPESLSQGNSGRSAERGAQSPTSGSDGLNRIRACPQAAVPRCSTDWLLAISVMKLRICPRKRSSLIRVSIEAIFVASSSRSCGVASPA